ncbi:MAG: DNA repair exonuclease, partial [bacterium]|nr:DNA repair exonuclease [bacterium]
MHTADIHLDSPLHRLEAYEGAPVEEVRQASRRAFENLIDFAVGESVDFVLIAGDLFDGDWKDYNTGLYFIRQVHRLKQADIYVFIISGNHDAAGRMTRVLPYLENVGVFSHKKPETKTLDTLKVAIHGQSFSTSAVTDNMALAYPDPVPGYFNIGLLHTSLNGREGHENYAPCTVEDLKNRGYDYWALGHVHQSEIVSSDPFIVFPGCIQGRHIRETGDKGGVLVTVESGSAPEVLHYP